MIPYAFSLCEADIGRGRIHGDELLVACGVKSVADAIRR